MRQDAEGPFDLLAVGHRPGALAAAARMQLRTLLLTDVEPSSNTMRRVGERVLIPPNATCAEVLDPVRARLRETRPRAVFAMGERGVLLAAALREALDVPGTRPAQAERVRDKAAMKAAVRAAGIPCADWLALSEDTTAEALISALGLPLVVKHRDGVGSRALRIARTDADVQGVLDAVPPSERSAWMAERFIDGIEMSLESFVAHGRILMTNPTEYFVPAYANIAPAALDPDTAAAVHDLNARVLDALGPLNGMTHLELFRTPAGPVFGEVALRPPGGRIMRLLRRAYDVDPWEAAIRLELGETPVLPQRAVQTAGAWMLHPGAGTVRAVRGLAAARRVLGVRKMVCRVGPGDVVAPRESTGADVGWIEVRGATRDDVAARMQAAHDAIRFDMEPVPTDTK